MCPECGHRNIASVPAPPSRPVRDRASKPAPAARPTSGRSAWIIGAIIVLLGSAWLGWLGRTVDIGSPAAAASTPWDARQQELLDQNLGRPGDPALGVMYQEINARHFDGALPPIPILWEPELASVGDLAGGSFALQGMYGYVGSQALILLTPELEADARALRRVLCHEMVHAYLHTIGNSTTTHGAPFQTVLRRLSLEGAFEGLVASDEERAAMRSRLDQEVARLDAETMELRRIEGQLEGERREIEHAMTALGDRSNPEAVARVMAQRDAYNERALRASQRAEQHQRDLQALDAEIARFNLIMAYPDGR